MGKVLVTGGSGLLGGTLVQKWRDEHDIVTTYHDHPVDFADVHCREVDLTDEVQVRALNSLDLDGIVHCAAMTDVDRCEREPGLAETHNVGMAEHIADLAADAEARLVHISTDAVFDGEKGNYTPADEPNPVNVYGMTKLKSESVVKARNSDSVVVRTNIYGWNLTDAQSLAEWMLSRLEAGENVPAFEDAYFTPIYTGDLADFLLELLGNNLTGTLHIAGSKRCSKLAFAYALADVFGYDRDLIEPSSMEDVDFDAPRGSDLSLAVERTREILTRPLPDVKSGLERMRLEKDE